MAALSKWACLPLLLVASVISFASAARIVPSYTDDHSSISTRTTTPSDDLDWLPVSRVKRELSITPSQHGKDDDHFSVSTSMDSAVISYPTPAPIRLFEKGEGVMSDEDVWKNIVVDGEVDHKDSLFRHSTGKEIDEIMDDLVDVRMDSSNSDGGFDDDECDTLLCGWGWNRGSNYGWGNEGSGTNGGGGGGIGSIGGLGGDGNDGGGGGGGGGDSNGWSWGGASTGGDSGGIGWNWGGGGSSGGGHIGRDGISIGSSGGSGRNSWHWGWHWGGGGSKVAVANDHNPNTDASGMSTNSATAPAPMSN